MKPKLFKGGIAIDKEEVYHSNSLVLNKIKRFYIVKIIKKILLEPGMDIK